MFGNHFKTWRLTGLLATVLMIAGPRTAAAQVTMYGQQRNSTRANVWNSFANNGMASGTYNVGASKGWARLSYPGAINNMCCSTAPDDLFEYWGNKVLGYGREGEAYLYSAGEGIIVATNVDGEKYVSYTGPNGPSEDVLPLSYDIQNSPEANWGIETLAPPGVEKRRDSIVGGSGVPTANWWAGATPQSDDALNQYPYEIHNHDYAIYPPLQNTAEEILVGQWTTKHDVVTTRRVLAWSHQDLDDFLIIEVEFENQGNKQLNDTYFGFVNAFYSSLVGTVWRWGGEGGIVTYIRPQGLDDWYKYSEATNFDGDPAAVGNYLSYQFDGNFVGSPDDDTGDPYIREFQDTNNTDFPGATSRPDGMPNSPAYVGFAPLAFRNSGTSHVFNPQDLAAGYEDPIGGDPVLSHWWEVFAQGNVDDPVGGRGRAPAERYDRLTGPTMDQPTEEGMGWHDQIYGPYNLAPGDKAKIVVVYVMGSGAEFDINSATGYNRDVTTWSWNLGGQGEAARRTKLAKGEQGLLKNLSHAQFAYGNAYQVPDSPPDVLMSFSNTENAEIKLLWKGAAETAINPDYGQADVTAYRVYQSEWQEYGPWELVAEVPATGADSYSYGDVSTISGFEYYYNIRAVASGKANWGGGSKTLADLPQAMQDHVTNGMEAGFSSPAQRILVSVSPKQPALAESDNLERKILVVPNPFSLADDLQNYQGVKKLRFVGVPHTCTISIFSVSGDLVGVVDHEDPASGEAVWLMKDRFLTGENMSGLYVYAVKSRVPGSLGQVARGTFVVLR